jgi:hypothetical protein
MTENRLPLVAAAEMGLGHLRAARSLADHLGTRVHRADRPPLATPREETVWARVRHLYELTSRLSQTPVVGPALRPVLNALTYIDHLHPYRDQSRPVRSVRTLDRMVERGLCRNLVERLRHSGVPLLTTFYTPAIAAARAGLEDVFLVVTDVDIHRVWAPVNPARTRIRYLVPSQRALQRLRAYGVPRANILHTGFPLPPELLGSSGDRILERNLAARLVRLDPAGVFRSQWSRHLAPDLADLPAEAAGPPQLLFAVGGAGAQTSIARRFLPGAAEAVRSGRLRLVLAAGTRAEPAERFRRWVREAGLGEHLDDSVRVLFEPDFDAYYDAFNRVLERTDILWTKPSELVFYAALGIPLILSWPVGVQERYNRRWVVERGAGLKQGDPRFAHLWISEWLREGLLAAAAWSGYLRLPREGTFRIAEAVRGAIHENITNRTVPS